MISVQEMLQSSVGVVNEELSFVGIHVGIEEAPVQPGSMEGQGFILWCHGEYVPQLHRHAMLTVGIDGVRVALQDSALDDPMSDTPKLVSASEDACELLLDVVSALLKPS